jgi:Tol biopolymer transport system component
MKSFATYAAILVSVTLAPAANGQEGGFPVLEGPYLGQEPPGMTPEVFAPGIVSVEKYSEFVCIFSPDGKECVFDRHGDDEYQRGAIFRMSLVDGRWTEPEIHEGFQDIGDVFLPTRSPDGQYWFFTSKTLPVPEGTKKIIPMYFVRETDSGWTEPQYLTQSIHASATLDHIVYVNAGRKITPHKGFEEIVDLYGAFSFETGHSCISPDGSYLIFDNKVLPRTGDCRLFVVFKKSEGAWTDPISLGKQIKQHAFCAWITPDGEYIFFHSQDNGKGNIYWVSAEIIRKLRQDID